MKSEEEIGKDKKKMGKEIKNEVEALNWSGLNEFLDLLPYSNIFIKIGKYAYAREVLEEE